MRKDKKEEKIKGRGKAGKSIVMGLLERHTGDEAIRVTIKVIEDTKKGTLHAEIQENVEPGSEVLTDGLVSCKGLAEYAH